MEGDERRRVLGAVLCGGAARRFGADKGAALWDGVALIDRAAAALAAQSDAVILCGAARAGWHSVPDRPAGGEGPLAGLSAALHHAAAAGFTHVLSAPVDVHPVPHDLRARFGNEEAPVVLDEHWLFGLWPAALAPALDAHIAAGHRSMRSWIAAASARRVAETGLALVNVNTPGDLARLGSAPLPPGARREAVHRLDFSTGAVTPQSRAVPVEAPVAIEYNGIGYAVMMATPTDLDDFVAGFTLSEGLVSAATDIGAVAIHASGGGFVVRATLPPEALPRVLERARTRVSESGCGVCGIESIAAALAPLEPLAAVPRVAAAAVHRALQALRDHQALGRATGASHAAAFCTADGAIVCVREDVGRHNALDKLVGALARGGRDTATGFVVLSARASQELVEKAVRAGVPMLVTISAPSTLAVDRAREGRLTLLALARTDSALVVSDPHGVFAGSAGKEWMPREDSNLD